MKTKTFATLCLFLSVIFYAYAWVNVIEAKNIKRDLSVRIDAAYIELKDVERQCQDIMVEKSID